MQIFCLLYVAFLLYCSLCHTEDFYLLFHLSIFAFIICVLDIISIKIIAKTKVKKPIPFVFLLVVLHFGVFISLELIFIMIWDKGPILFFSMWISTFSNTIYWRDNSVTTVYSWYLAEDHRTHMHGFISVLNFVPLVYTSVFLLIPILITVAL